MGETDLISRRAAIEAIKTWGLIDGLSEGEAIEILADEEKLPSAQPEIIRCKDCKNSKHWYRDRRRCFLWSEDGVSVFDDGFCNYAERRTDE